MGGAGGGDGLIGRVFPHVFGVGRGYICMHDMDDEERSKPI